MPCIFRLMKKHGLLLQRSTHRPRPREHGGKIITVVQTSAVCRCFGAHLWNGEIVRVAFSTATPRSSPGRQEQLDGSNNGGFCLREDDAA